MEAMFTIGNWSPIEVLFTIGNWLPMVNRTSIGDQLLTGKASDQVMWREHIATIEPLINRFSHCDTDMRRNGISSHSHTLSISHLLTLDMLNNFCFHLYTQKSLFIGENDNEFFLTAASPDPVTFEFIELVPS